VDVRARIESKLGVYRCRIRLLLCAIYMALVSVLLAALMIVTLFANYLFGTTFRGLVIVCFAFSLLSLVVSLVLFIRDMRLSLTAIREELRDIL
jgi:hypothetical protein